MKTVFQKYLVFYLGLAISIFLIAACNPETPEKVVLLASTPVSTPYPEEDIDLSQHAVLEPDGRAQLEKAHNDILLNCSSKDSIPKIVDIIDRKHLETLIGVSKNIDTSFHGQRIYALRLIYGLKDDSSMEIIYQPLLLKRTSNEGLTINVEYKADSSNIYYKYDENFQVVDTSYLYTCVRKYQSNITFVTSKKKGQKVCRTFNYATDSTGDVRRIVYSYTEIDSLLKHHNSTELYILSAAKVFHINGKDHLKHLILLGSENFHLENKIRTLTSQGLFFQKFGNLSHLCPPSCSFHTFNLKKSK